MARRHTPTFSALVLGVLAGCPSPGGGGATDTDTDATSTGEPLPTTGPDATSDDATTDAETDATSTGDDPSTGDGTTGEPPPPAGARVLYFVEGPEPDLAASLRLADRDDAATPPVTLVTVPDGGLLFTDITLSGDRRWGAVRGAATDQTGRLWLIDLHAASPGTAPEAELAAGVRAIGARAFSPDAGTLAFVGKFQGGVGRLYLCALAPDGACVPEEWSPPVLDESVGVVTAPAFAARAPRIAYAADLVGDGTLQIVVGDATAPGEATALATYPGPTDVRALQLTADGGALYFAVDQGAGDEFFAVDLSQDPPGEPVALHPGLAPARARLAPDLRALLVWTGEDKHGDLMWISLDGAAAGEPALVNVDGPGRVYDARLDWSADGRGLLYLSDHAQPGTNELWFVDVAGAAPAAPVRLSGPLGPDGTVSRGAFTPDGSRAVYYARPEGQGDELFVAAVAAPGEATLLSAPLPKGGSLSQNHRFSGDSTRVLYHGPQDELGVNELYFVDLAQPAAPARVNAPLPMGGNVKPTFDFSPDGQRAYFLASTAAGVTALFEADLAGGQPGAPVEVSAAKESVATLLVLPPPP